MLRGVRCAALMTGASFAEIGNARPPPPEERQLVIKRQLQQFIEQGHVKRGRQIKNLRQGIAGGFRRFNSLGLALSPSRKRARIFTHSDNT
jgi:hypothetical protein